MKKTQGAVFDRRVGAVSNVSVTVYNQGTSEKPTIYSDNGVTPQANPFQTDSLGRWAFYVANGRYDIEFSGSTINTFKMEDVLIEEGGGGVTHHGALTGLGDDDHTQYQLRSEKAAASGYPSLDANTKVPTVELGGTGADNTKFLRGDQSWQSIPGGGDMLKSTYDPNEDGIIVLAQLDPNVCSEVEADAIADALIASHEAVSDPHIGYQKESEKSAANGYPSLDANIKVPTAQLGGAGADNTKYLRGDQSWEVPAGGGSQKQRIRIPAAALETRVATGWAAFVQVQNANLDFGELDFDKDTDEKAISPPFRFSNWNAGNITVRIGWKANATTGNVMWVVSFLGRDTTTPEAWDAAFTNHALSVETTPGTAEYLKESVWTGAVAELANNDAVLCKITRDADHASDTLAVDAKLLYVEIEYTEA